MAHCRRPVRTWAASQPRCAVNTRGGRLRREGTLPIQILGSGELVRTLHRAGLIDRYTLLVHPIVMGSGRRLFGDADRVDLTLEQALPTTTGVVIVEYSVNSAAR